MPDKQSISVSCCICGCALGAQARELPVLAREDGGDGAGKMETFCPQCFQWCRAPLSPERWHWLAICAFACSRCGVTSLNFTGPSCGQCGAQQGLALPAKPNGGHAPINDISKAVLDAYKS